jgi:hypothetical protein
MTLSVKRDSQYYYTHTHTAKPLHLLTEGNARTLSYQYNNLILHSALPTYLLCDLMGRQTCLMHIERQLKLQ